MLAETASSRGHYHPAHPLQPRLCGTTSNRSRGVDVGGVPRVGEPDAALSVNGQVVGGVEPLALDLVGDDGIIAVGVEAQDSAAAGAGAK